MPENQYAPKIGASTRYCLVDLDKKLGRTRISIPRVWDAAECLREDELELLHERLDRFQNSFARLFAGFYLGSIPAQMSASELGFWLLNRAAVEDVDYHRLNEHGIFFVVDVFSRTASVTTGYGLEAALPASFLKAVLRAFLAELAGGHYAAGFIKALDLLENHLHGLARLQSQAAFMHSIVRSLDEAVQPAGMIA